MLSFMNIEMPLARAGLLDKIPAQGNFGIPGAKVIAPGDPFRSILYYRMAKLGPGRMPHAGSNVIDTAGLDLIHEWIRQLPGGAPPASSISNEQRAALDTLCAPSGAAAMAQTIDTLLSSP